MCASTLQWLPHIFTYLRQFFMFTLPAGSIRPPVRTEGETGPAPPRTPPRRPHTCCCVAVTPRLARQRHFIFSFFQEGERIPSTRTMLFFRTRRDRLEGGSDNNMRYLKTCFDFVAAAEWSSRCHQRARLGEAGWAGCRQCPGTHLSLIISAYSFYFDVCAMAYLQFSEKTTEVTKRFPL